MRKKIKVLAEIEVAPMQAVDILIALSAGEFADALHLLHARTRMWGADNREHLWGQVRRYLDNHPDKMAYAMVNELEEHLRPPGRDKRYVLASEHNPSSAADHRVQRFDRSGNPVGEPAQDDGATSGRHGEGDVGD